MKEDILEQIVDDYLKTKGYFTKHNVKFKPSKDDLDYNTKSDCVASDIDVVGYHPMLAGADRIWVVSCKSWQEGFDPRARIDSIEGRRRIVSREGWKYFRELAKEKWAKALVAEVRNLTGSTVFTHVTAVTKLKGDRNVWEQHQPFKDKLGGNPIRVIELNEMLTDMHSRTGTAVASSEIGRLLQVIKASGWLRKDESTKQN